MKRNNKNQKNTTSNFDSLQEDGTTSSRTGTTDGKSAIQTDEIKSGPSLSEGVLNLLINFLTVPAFFVSLILTLMATEKLPSSNPQDLNVFSIGKVVANKYPIFDIDIFDTKESNGKYADVLKEIKEQIALWYVTIRNLSLMILVIILLYIATRMLLGTTSMKSAQLKDMLIGWVSAVFLVFTLQYLFVGIVAIANLADSIIDKIAGDQLLDVESKIMSNIWAHNGQSLLSKIFYMLTIYGIIYYQIKFFALYMGRMGKTYILLMIAPLICVTYPIDRIADDRGQSLRTWFIEFSTSLLMQPFQYMIYVIIFGSFDEIMLKVPILTFVAFYFIGKSFKFAKQALQIKSNSEIDKDLEKAGINMKDI